MDAYLDSDDDVWVQKHPGLYVCAGSESDVQTVLGMDLTGRPLAEVEAHYGPIRAITVDGEA
jgi:hypothetical protein